MSHLSERDVLAKTIYAEARGEPDEGQRAVAHVIKNRAAKNRDYWGGSSVKGVCLKDKQFECWNGRSDIDINEPHAYQKAQRIADEVLSSRDPRNDPSRGSTHYNNPDKEDPDWGRKIPKTTKIGKHQFYE
ncbi:spore cortex-lytic enzyme [Folsomia candida]|uniref:Spore cortex-lytic enzyme n=1 Tax=Folsomia candida TaxID=158441 RepID=A0A226D4B9_FOLCA|nr:spore cortex-lytic enzyme [Folsomia candida]OXA39491.1 Spore cortex-lytic enzyme [Folsomia candida]